EKAEKKFQETEDERAKRGQAREETHERQLDDARKLLQARDRENAKRIKDVEALQASLRAASEALERRELELAAESTRAKAALDSEAHRSAALEKDLNVSRKELAKSIRSFETAKAEAEAARRQAQDRQKEFAADLTKAQAALDEGKRNDARDRKSTRLNSSHVSISYAVFCLK